MDFILSALKKEKDYEKIKNNLWKKKGLYLATGLCESLRSFLCAGLFLDTKKKIIAVFPDESKAYSALGEISSYNIEGVFLPACERNFARSDATSHDFDFRRLSALSRGAKGDYDIIFTTAEALCQITVDREKFLNSGITFAPGMETDLEVCVVRLMSMGYTRCDMVDGRGQFSKRGDILDIYPPESEFPVRIEFFGDEVDTVSAFDLSSQRRIDTIKKFTVFPAFEEYADNSAKEKIIARLNDKIEKCGDENIKALFREDIDRLENGLNISYEPYTDIIFPERATFFDYLRGDEGIIVFDTVSCLDRLDATHKIIMEGVTSSIENGMSQYSGFFSYDKNYFTEKIGEFSTLLVNNFVMDMLLNYNEVYDIGSRKTVNMSQNTELFFDDIKGFVLKNYSVVVLSQNSISAENLISMIREKDIYSFRGDLNEIPDSGAVSVVSVMVGDERRVQINSGFELTHSRFVLLLDHTSGGEVKKSRRHRSEKADSSKERIMSYADLEIGDLVVHINHGIGVYGGIRSMLSDGVKKDYIIINYAEGDVLYLPCSSLDSISKYIGGGAGGHVKINRLGGSEWKKAKAQAKAAASDIAKELIKLYSQRRNAKGHAFSPDTPWQAEFEGSFEYEETDGQLRAVEEIKADMESEIPMDRLLCGDVGFGKTEVALRGIFKCVMDSMQAAILAPTTVLAWQHYNTIINRFRGYPIKVALLSRFSTAKEIRSAIDGIKDGSVDIVVGTHRLLQKDVEFKKLGFLVVDEEQRFGVSHKEKLKEMAKDVDVLTLTATPIPRTLNMALSGIRDMSILEEAPGDRFPVQTYVMEYDDKVIFEAIRREVARGGQVFYLINNTELLESRARLVIDNVEGVVVATAHGQMDKDELSEIWRDMYDGKIDVLVCTTIIETGVDVPNANTLIIENAENYGLSQLHQIRGRVGRSTRKAYAYLTYRKFRSLSEVAEKRLSAIKEFCEFGSGFKIAMRDLEIRGAGNILGAEQHGHMDSVGYDLYIKLLDEAMREEKGEAEEVSVEDKIDTVVDIGIDAYIPEKYISSEKIRIEIYKKISSVVTDDDISEIVDELCDRFGEVPKAVMNLISVSQIRHMLSELGVSRAVQNEDKIYLYTDIDHRKPAEALCMLNQNKLSFSSGTKPFFILKTDRKTILDDLEKVCSDYKIILENY